MPRALKSIAPLVILFVTLFAHRAHAQVTTADLRGTVRSSDDGTPMAGAEVTLRHEPTGNTKTATTNDDGDFRFTGLRVGGPYTVIATVMSFKPAEERGIILSAGKTRDVKLRLQLAEEVIEVAGSIARNTSGRTLIGAAEIDSLPSVSRDPRDLVRRSPEVTVEGSNHTLSFGGANPRFNSITIDGIRQDDDFGLNQSGYPTRRSPIALSAIEELAVDSSPFDVRYGKFLGGNVNIVTKSGTNEFKGELLGTYSSDALMGRHSDSDTLNLHFREIRYGATVGGPILKDKVHFLLSGEGLTANVPVDVGPAGSGATNTVSKVTAMDLSEAQRIARDVYGFDPGVPARSLDEGDLKLLGKVDWEISKQHRVSATFQRTNGNAIQNSSSSDSSLPLSSNWYNARDVLNTFSGRLFSDWSDKLSTEAEFSGKLVSSNVDPLNGNGFMQATIRTATGGQIVLGPDEFRHTNELSNDVLHGKVLANYLAGKSLLTAGVEYDRLKIHNLFIADTNGAAVYPSLAAFEAMTPLSILYSNSVTLNPADAAANWGTGTLTAYAQDQLKLTPDLTVTGGVRFELYQSDTNIVSNPNFMTRHGFANTSTINGRNVIMPRLGLSYLATEKLNLRGGAGLYSGGTPSVWVSNNYSNDGVRIASVFDSMPGDIAGFNGRNIPQPLKDMIKSGNGNVDALDPNFKIPSTWKANTGLDYTFDLGSLKNFELKLNYTYSKVFHGVTWRDLRRDLPSLPNNTPIGTLPDGRPLYDTTAFNATRGYDMLLTNTNQGFGHSASIQLQKGFPFGLFISGSYAYQNVQEVNPANSSRSVSNYGLLAVTDPNNPGLAISNYERQHRFTLALEFSRSLVGDLSDSKPWKDMKTSFGMFIETRSGQPYSWTFADANFGGTLAKIYGEDRTFASRNHQLFYVPKGDGSDVTLNGIDPAAFDAFLSATGLDKYRGQIAPRNAFHSPWFSKIDLRFAQDLPNPLSGHRARFVLDLENFGNMLNHKWGRATGVPFPFMAPAVDVNYDTASGKYVYSNLRSPSATRVDIVASVWRISLGLMYDF